MGKKCVGSVPYGQVRQRQGCISCPPGWVIRRSSVPQPSGSPKKRCRPGSFDRFILPSNLEHIGTENGVLFLRRLAGTMIMQAVRSLWFIRSTTKDDELSANPVSTAPAMIDRAPFCSPTPRDLDAHVAAARFFASRGFDHWVSCLFFGEDEFNTKYFREKFLEEADRRRKIVGLAPLNGELAGCQTEDDSESGSLHLVPLAKFNFCDAGSTTSRLRQRAALHPIVCPPRRANKTKSRLRGKRVKQCVAR